MIPHDRLTPSLVGTRVRVAMYAEDPCEGTVVGLADAGCAPFARTTWLQVDVGGGRVVERPPSRCTELARESTGRPERWARTSFTAWVATG